MTPTGFEIVLDIRYNRAKLLNTVIAFWAMTRSKKFRVKRARKKNSSRMYDPSGK